MITIKCQGCGEVVSIGRICRECGASIPSAEYQGAKEASDAYGKVPAALVQLNALGLVNEYNIGGAVQLFRDCSDLLQKMDAYQSFFQDDFNTLKTKTNTLDGNIRATQQQYNIDINDLSEKINALLGKVSKLNFQKAKSLCRAAGSFKKSEYDTGQYENLQSKKNDLETETGNIEKKITARKQVNAIKTKRLIMFLVCWAVFTGIISAAFILQSIYPISDDVSLAILIGSIALIGGIISFIIFFASSSGFTFDSGAGASVLSKIYAIEGSIGFFMLCRIGHFKAGATIGLTIVGAIAGAIAGAILGAISGAIDGAIKHPVISSVFVSIISAMLASIFGYLLLSDVTLTTQSIVFCIVLFILFLFLYTKIRSAGTFAISTELTTHAGGNGVSFTFLALLVIVAAVVTYVRVFNGNIFQRAPKPTMVLVQGGTFTMGSPASEPGREANEGPQHQVTVSSFYMGKNEVTVEEFRKFSQDMEYKTTAEAKGGGRVVINDEWAEKADASWEYSYLPQTDQDPVVLVSWYDAVEYCNWRSVQEGLTLAYTINGTTVNCDWDADGYRLPTEAEWEYACRAGTTTTFSAGDNITTSQANYDGNSPYNGNAKGEYRQTTTAVGSFDPNPWGLYDMHGNVYEWCWDTLGTYRSGEQTDPAGPAAGSNFVVRGGSWYRSGRFIRSACRIGYAASYRDNTLGFRVVRKSSPDPIPEQAR